MRGTLYRLSFWTLLALSVPVVACNRWRPARAYEVQVQQPGRVAYDATHEVLAAGRYQVVERNDDARRARVRAHAHESNDAQASFIQVEVAPDGRVTLTPSGYLVRADGTIHRKLEAEVEELERAIALRLNGQIGAPTAAVASGGSPAPAPSPPSTPAASSGAVPHAWTERAYDPGTWGSDEFTCIPARIPPEQQSELRLQLSNGQEASVAISIAYAPELCRSPQQCSLPGGCPALGLGDEQQVQALAGRIARKEVSSQATLVARGTPLATLDLSRHGSVAKALAQIKK